MLVIEDLHWADDATIDALRYLTRRLETVNAVVVLTCRDDDIDDSSGLPRLMGTLATVRVLRLRIGPLSRLALIELAEDADVDVDQLLTVTGETRSSSPRCSACGGSSVPTTVVDAVMARVGNLSPGTRAAVDSWRWYRLAWSWSSSNALVPSVETLAEAERRTLIEVRVDGVAFRHELVRRAIVHSVPSTRRAILHRPVLRHLLAETRPDLSRVMHHAVAAGAIPVIVSHGPKPQGKPRVRDRTGSPSPTTSTWHRTCSTSTAGTCSVARGLRLGALRRAAMARRRSDSPSGPRPLGGDR